MSSRQQKNIQIRLDQATWIERAVDATCRRHGISRNSRQVSNSSILRALLDGVINSGYDVTAYGNEDKLREAIEEKLSG